MLIYNKAYDLFHSIFRILQLTEQNGQELELDKVRILDFYMAFPSELLNIQTFRGFKKYEPFLRDEANNYERLIDRRRVFFKMEYIQIQAIKALVSYGFLDANFFKDGKIKRTEKNLPDDLHQRILTQNERYQTLLELLSGPMASMNLFGHLGLKERTNLIEFKYDSI